MAGAQPVLLSMMLSPGDHLMLTSFVRDLHLVRPGKFRINVETASNFKTNKQIWENNPDLDLSVTHATPGVMALTPHYHHAMGASLRDKTIHFARGFHIHMAQKFEVEPLPLTDLRGRLELTEQEKAFVPPTEKYWVLFAGGKTDFLTKLWDRARWQQLVELLPDTTFVQAGNVGAIPDGLVRYVNVQLYGKNVIDMRGKTTIRELAALISKSSGVISPVSLGMHMAAAFRKPCVVIAGGREPPWWEHYSEQTWWDNVRQPPVPDFVPHRFLHSLGTLPCCEKHACGATGLGNHQPINSNCKRIVGGESSIQPECLFNITAEMVAEAVISYTPTVNSLIHKAMALPKYKKRIVQVVEIIARPEDEERLPKEPEIMVLSGGKCPKFATDYTMVFPDSATPPAEYAEMKKIAISDFYATIRRHGKQVMLGAKELTSIAVSAEILSAATKAPWFEFKPFTPVSLSRTTGESTVGIAVLMPDMTKWWFVSTSILQRLGVPPDPTQFPDKAVQWGLRLHQLGVSVVQAVRS